MRRKRMLRRGIMLIIDEQTVSPILVQTALKHRLPIYYMDDERPLDIKEHSKILTNSESCLQMLQHHHPEHIHTKVSQLVKNKARFRGMVADLDEDYNFNLVTVDELLCTKKENVPFPVVIKPNRGYSSVGVYIVKEEKEWDQAVQLLYSDLLLSRSMYSDAVLDSEQIIIEGYIEGQEYALDCYYDEAGEPVILNILKRRFAHDQDTSDRIYYTSSLILDEVRDQALDYLRLLNDRLHLQNYPFHIEMRKNETGVIPIEMNPLRFAGAGTTDVSHYAYDINSALSYFKGVNPDWETIVNRADEAYYGFFCAEVPVQISMNLIQSIEHDKLKKQFSDVMEYRVIQSAGDRTFAVIFFRTHCLKELDRLLTLDLEPFLTMKPVKEAVR
ncbi:ATP-grasp domain-containing protein [Halobacillus halophilus]|nr:ATP-grasp domain-containing protein [Halobacillus halophilus]